MTHQGVAFRHDGALIDGQHRLSAIIEAGMPADLLVVRGLPNNAFMAIDNGIKRSMADLTGLPKKAAETCRLLASYIFYGVTLPSTVLDVANSGVAEIHEQLMEHCASSRAYYASAPMRAAAIISIMDGQDRDYVFSCYKALVTDDFSAMSDFMFSLVRQVNKGAVSAMKSGDTFARGLKLFNKKNSKLSLMKINESEISEALRLVRGILKPLIDKNIELESKKTRANRSGNSTISPTGA